MPDGCIQSKTARYDALVCRVAKSLSKIGIGSDTRDGGRECGWIVRWNQHATTVVENFLDITYRRCDHRSTCAFSSP